MDSIFVALAYIAMLATVVYATRGRGRRMVAALVIALLGLIAATYAGGTPEGVANHALILIVVGLAGAVLFVLSKRKKQA